MISLLIDDSDELNWLALHVRDDGSLGIVYKTFITTPRSQHANSSEDRRNFGCCSGKKGTFSAFMLTTSSLGGKQLSLGSIYLCLPRREGLYLFILGERSLKRFWTSVVYLNKTGVVLVLANHAAAFHSQLRVTHELVSKWFSLDLSKQISRLYGNYNRILCKP